MPIVNPDPNRLHRFGVGARVQLAKAMLDYPAGAEGVVAEQLLGIGRKPRYGVKLDCNGGRVTTDVSQHEIAPADPILRRRP